MVSEWPDFFEKDYTTMRESKGVLGQMYRDISNEQAMEELLRQDHRASIRLDYQLDKRIIGQVKDTKAMLSYLSEAYEVIVKPMTSRLKQLSMDMNFGYEAEIFASDLRFSMFGDKSCEEYKAAQPMKLDDLDQYINGRLNSLIETF